MSLKYLSQPIDIHCGGTDHVRIHHTNEIAQTEAATKKQFVRYWLHGEFLTMTDAKMAKSGGNFITLDTVKERGTDPLAYRMFCFTAHYRSPLAFSWEGLAGSAQSLKNLRKLISALSQNVDKKEDPPAEKIAKAIEPFYTAVYDDLNMPRAVAALWEMVRDTSLEPAVRRAALVKADAVCGLDLFRAEAEIESTVDESGTIRVTGNFGTDADKQKIFQKIRDRREARKLKDFKKADVIRDDLISLGIAIKDLPSGITECTALSA
jgi:cysteinyl-tRNA synthetase